MANCRILVPIIKSWEGGNSNNAGDLGGSTHEGITLATYVGYCNSKGLPVPSQSDLFNMPDETWFDVFKSLYWDKWIADEITNQSVANILVDWLWGSGTWGIKIPQGILGVVQDGSVGQKTIQALNSANQQDLFNKIHQARLDFVAGIVAHNPSQAKWINGWNNRINSFKFQA